MPFHGFHEKHWWFGGKMLTNRVIPLLRVKRFGDDFPNLNIRGGRLFIRWLYLFVYKYCCSEFLCYICYNLRLKVIPLKLLSLSPYPNMTREVRLALITMLPHRCRLNAIASTRNGNVCGISQYLASQKCNPYVARSFENIQVTCKN